MESFLDSPCALVALCLLAQMPEGWQGLSELARLARKPPKEVEASLHALAGLNLVELRKRAGKWQVNFHPQEGAGLGKELHDFLWAHQDEYGKVYKTVLTLQIADLLKSRDSRSKSKLKG